MIEEAHSDEVEAVARLLTRITTFVTRLNDEFGTLAARGSAERKDGTESREACERRDTAFSLMVLG